jgi:hypothetical protein
MHMSVTLTGPNKGAMQFGLSSTNLDYIERVKMAVGQLDGVGNIRFSPTSNVLHVEHSLPDFAGDALTNALADLHNEITEVMESIREYIDA